MKQHYVLRSRGWLSLLVHKRTLSVSLVLILVCLGTAILSLGLGTMRITPVDVVRSLLGIGPEEQAMIIHKLRLPRIVVGFLVGAALAASGAIMQGIIRNPLASPDVLGVTGGAAVAAIFFLTYLSGTLSIRFLPVSAMLGAFVLAIILYLLAWRKGVTPIRLVLVGVGLSYLMSAMTTMMMLFNPTNDAGPAYLWLIGSIYAADWEDVMTLLPWISVLFPAAFLCIRHVNIGQLGDDIARSAGSRVQLNRLILLLISVALAGSAVAVAGGIGFVGLIAPHMARKLVGPSFGSILPVAALLGGILVLLADLAGRLLFIPLDIPAGIFISAIGAPFFIYLLYSRRNSG